MRREFRNLYRHPDDAFGAMDMHGSGFVTMPKFLSSIVCKRIEENTKKLAINQKVNQTPSMISDQIMATKGFKIT